MYQAHLTEELARFEQALARQDKYSMVRFAQRAKDAAFSLKAPAALALTDRLEQAARDVEPLEPDAMQDTLASLKAFTVGCGPLM